MVTKTGAQQAKAIMNRYKIRLGEKFDKGDALSLEAMNQELSALQEKQEQARLAEQEAAMAFEEGAIETFANGGKLSKKQQKTISEILTSRKQGSGMFAYGGEIPEKAALSSTGLAKGKKPSQYSEQQLRLGIDVEHEHTKNNALAVKIAMDHLEENPNYYGTGNKAQAEQLAQQHAAADAAKYAMGGELYAYGGGLPKFDGFSMSDLNKVGSTETFIPNGGEGSWISGAASGGDAGGADPFTPFQSRVPYFGAVAQGLGSILANRKIDFGDNEIADIKGTKIAPNLVDYSRGREQTMRERDQANALITRGARGTGSQAGLMENIMAGTTATQRQAGTAFNQSLENEGNVNAQIRNEVAARNAQTDLQTAMTNQRNQQYNQQMNRENLLINEQRRGDMIGGVTNAITGYGRDRIAADQYDQMLGIMAPDNYAMGQDKDSALRRWLQISPTMKRSFRNTSDNLYQG